MLRGPQIKESSDLDYVSKNTNYVKCFKMHRMALYLPLMQENSLESSVKCQRDTLWILWGLWNAIKKQQCKSSNKHWLPSIRPFPAPLVKDHHPCGSLPSHELHCIFITGFMTVLPLSVYQQNSDSTAVKQRGLEMMLKQLLFTHQILDVDRALEKGLHHSLGCKKC